MRSKSPLGENTDYRETYAPALLHAIPRADNRRILGLADELPFRGEDIWNAYELTWLDDRGKPVAATAEIRVPAHSPNIIESKSMKLYLNSLAMMRYTDGDVVAETIAGDLTQSAGAAVTVQLDVVTAGGIVGELPGVCIDDLDVHCASEDVDPELLSCANNDSVSEELHSHLLRSRCPVTDQPDSGSILIRYRGRQIDRGSLLRYLVSYRNHNAFHENCVERIFVDISKRCGPEKLTVYARYNRRGGLDINPFRSNYESSGENIRLWRQ